MYKYTQNLPKHIENLEKTCNNYLLKHISNEKIEKFHKIINQILQERDIIVKGSRALNNSLSKENKIYTDEELTYVDYDLYSLNPKEDIVYIANKLYENDIEEVYVTNIVFKPDIYRLQYYTFPYIDIELIENLDEIPHVKDSKNIIYVHPKYQKIDMYSQFGRPTIINVLNWDKVTSRLKITEKEFPYKKYYEANDSITIVSKRIQNFVEYFYTIIGRDVVITGNMAYYLHMEKFKNNSYFPEIKYVEIYCSNCQKYIKLIENKYPNIECIKHTTHPFYELRDGEDTLMFLWSIEDCVNFVEYDGIKYSDYYHLMYYYLIVKYRNIVKDIFQQWKVTETMLYDLLLRYKDKDPSIRCIGNRNPGVNNLKDIFFKNKKDELFKYSPALEKKSI